MSNVIEVENLSKSYQISHLQNDKPKSLRELATRSISSLLSQEKRNTDVNTQTEEFWALKDVSFNVAEGERLAIIGSNGAGKSTLLKILSRITEPTFGKVKISGKVASLLEVGTGFHPELTGRENIYLNGAILGMRKAEIQSKFDQIVQFSGVEKFIDTPVKHYSSGMYVRLAFSVSAWLDPDILIVDEVLSVGDQAFQKRCAERMKELTGDGRTVIFVSHSMAAVNKMCEKALFLQKGQVASYTTVEEASADYVRSIADDEGIVWHKPSFTPTDSDIVPYIDNPEFVTCLGGEIQTEAGVIESRLNINQSFKAVVRYKVNKSVPHKLVPNFHLYDEFGGRFFISFPEMVAPNSIGEHSLICHFPAFLFNVGRFSLMPILSSYEMVSPVHFAFENALRFEVNETNLIDERRHGWSGALPGISRPRLNWEYQSN